MTAVVILAGGAGQRLGGNKPFHPYGTTTLIGTAISRLKTQTEALFINSGSRDHPLTDQLAGLGLPLIFDESYPGMGPLSGVLAALELARVRGDEHVITLPCDMPLLPIDIVEQLLAAPESDVAFFAGNRDYPLCARWASHLENRLASALAQARPSGGLAVHRFLESATCVRLPVVDDAAFRNVNSLGSGLID